MWKSLLLLVLTFGMLVVSVESRAQSQATDNFNRANGGLGSKWTVNSIGVPLQISGNQLQTPAGEYAESQYTATTFGGAQFSEVQYVSGLSAGVINLVVRASNYASGGVVNSYIGQLNGFQGLWKIILRTGGNETFLTSGALTHASGDTFYFEANGSTLTLKRNGTTIGSITDGTYTAGDAGVGLYSTGGLLADNWRGGEIGSNGDTQPPSAPSTLSASPASSAQINLSWAASTDNVSVTAYLIERCQGASCSNFTEITTATGTTHNDPGLAAATTYRYRVRARDAANNLSGYSPIASATTSSGGGGDTQPPSVPASLSATAASSAVVNASWLPSTDNVGVTAYLLERCTGSACTNFTQIATPTSPSYSDTGVSESTTYRYRVRARDAANNMSGYSNVATATTPQTNPNCE